MSQRNNYLIHVKRKRDNSRSHSLSLVIDFQILYLSRELPGVQQFVTQSRPALCSDLILSGPLTGNICT